ncbi:MULTISPECIES: helix-turn-helix domain-containing protein [unclassified Streptomyces]|uniref:nSTAND1 domain-containing NTPase n=1 Tax=unclassified Streptomyces TaxID=2593676 RepID=UPI0036E8D274
MAGRREVPVDPAAGPVQRFAWELRELRARADGSTYRALARRAGYSVTTLSQAAAGEQLPTLPVALAYAGACGGDLAQWEARWKQAVEDSAACNPGGNDGSPAPYQGLARFETAGSALFFGREQLTAELLDLLGRRRFAAVFGPSGSGKSSLLRAGLIPLLRSGEQPGPRPAAIRILTPGERPARTHASLLAPAPPRDGAAEADTIVIVDQFEEVFTLCHDPAERARFIDQLLTARRPESRLRVLVAVRSDFYGRCAEHRELADALRDANLLVGAMSQAELRDAVVKPATATGLTVERALTACLVAEVADAPGGLPLLSHALLETWRGRRGKTLTLAGYEAAGGLHGAIAKTAEEVYGRFTADQAAAARRVLLRMVAPGDGTPDTRRPLDRSELPATGREATAHVVEALAGVRLLTLDGDTVEFAHEALLTAWPRLRGWIEEDRERLRVHRKVTEAARAWQELGRETGALYRGSRLAAAQEHFGGAAHADLTDVEHAFLDAGRRHEHRGRRRHRMMLTAVTAALCLALLAAGLAMGQWRTAVTAQHLAQSRQLAAQSGALLDSEPDLAALLAVHAYRTSPTREATAALYAAAALPPRLRLTGGAAPVDSLAASPDGHTLAAHSKDGRLRIWELPAGRVRHTLTGHGAGDVAVFSPDGRTLAVAAEGSATVWDAVAGRRLGTFGVPDGAVRGLAFSPDGRMLAAASPMAVRVWEVATGRVRHRFTQHPDPEAVAFGPDGRTVAAVGSHGPLRVWDMATGHVRTARDNQVDVLTVEFSPDGRRYATLREDGVVQLREVATGAVRRTLRGGPTGIHQVAFSSDGRTLAAPGRGGTVRLWDTASGTARATVTADHHGQGVMRVALGADGRTLVTSSNRDPSLRVQRLPTGEPRAVLRGEADTHVNGMAFSPDGRTLATVRQGPPGRGSAQLWDATTGHGQAALTLDAPSAAPPEEGWPGVLRLGAVAFTPTGRALAARAVGNGVIEVRDVATGRLLHRRVLGAGHTAVFSPDGTRLAHVGENGVVRIWHLSTGVVRIWQRSTGALRTARTGTGQTVRTVAFTPDGGTLAVVGIEPGGDEVALVDTDTGRTRHTVEPRGHSPLTVAFSPDGRTLATVTSGGGVVKTWDARTGGLLGGFTVGGEVASVAFSPDARTLATSGTPGVQLWDLATRQVRATLPTRSLAPVAFGPDGRTLAVSEGGSAELRPVDLPDPTRALRTICEAVDTPLTPAQRSRYLPDRSTATGCPPAG